MNKPIIPDGWHQETQGICKKEDQWWSKRNSRWQPISMSVGNPIYTISGIVIRKDELATQDFEKDEDDLDPEDDKSVYECEGEKVIRIGNICTGGYTQYWLPYEPLKTMKMSSIVAAIKSGKVTLYYTGDDPFEPSDGMLITGMWQEYAERLGKAPNYWTGDQGGPDPVKTKETHNLVLPNKLFQVTWRDV